MDEEKKVPQAQPNNPLHGVKLITILESVREQYSWEELGDMFNINCFRNKPTFKSSLKFLRRTAWARDKVEKLYLNMIKKK